MVGVLISECHPDPHAKYVVVRDGLVFTATPCYGMHSPWWVVTTMGDGVHTDEAPPVPFRPDDRYWPLAECLDLLACG